MVAAEFTRLFRNPRLVALADILVTFPIVKCIIVFRRQGYGFGA